MKQSLLPHATTLLQILILNYLSGFCNSYVVRPNLPTTATTEDTTEDVPSEEPISKSHRIISLDQVIQLHDMDTGLFVSLDKITNKFVLSDRSQDLRSLFELAPAQSIDPELPSDAWLIRSMFKTNKYICQNKKNKVYLSKLKKGCLLHKVIDTHGVTFYNYKRWTKLLVNTIEPNQFIPENSETTGHLDVVSAPWPIKALITDMSVELYTSDSLKLSDVIWRRLQLSGDPQETLIAAIDPLKGTLENTLLRLSKYDWYMSVLFDDQHIDWKTLMRDQLPFLAPFVQYQHFQD